MWELQTILFNKENFNLNQVIKWLNERGYKTNHRNKPIDETENFYRARQKDPNRLGKPRYKSYTTVGEDDIKYVYGKLE
jgi:hypothetical protein